jgi:hypothetical protein
VCPLISADIRSMVSGLWCTRSPCARLGRALGWKLRRMICHLGQEFLEPTIPCVAAPIMRTHLWRGAWPATSGSSP